MNDRIAWTRSPEERLKIRQEKEISIIDELISTIQTEMHGAVLSPLQQLGDDLFCLEALEDAIERHGRSEIFNAD